MRSWLSCDVIRRQPSCSGPTRFATGTRTSCVVGGVGALAAERVDRRHREARRARRHQDDRDALVLRRVGIGARGEPDVVGVVGVGREDLLAVDHVVVAVADGARRERGEVGAGAGLGVADAEVELALQDAGQQLRLLLRAVPNCMMRRADRVDRDDRQRRARAVGLVPEDELLERPCGPGRRTPSASRCRASRRAPMRPTTSRKTGPPISSHSASSAARSSGVKSVAVVAADLAGGARCCSGVKSRCIGPRRSDGAPRPPGGGPGTGGRAERLEHVPGGRRQVVRDANRHSFATEAPPAPTS